MPDRQQRAEETRAAIVAAARSLFVEKGYFATGTEEIVALAGVGTRGALYHHFHDKRALFLEVFEQVELELTSSVPTSRRGDVLDLLRQGLQSFLDASADDPAVQRIVLIDGPAVLGWDEWRALEAKHGLGVIRYALDHAHAEGLTDMSRTESIAHMLLAMVDEAALYVANADDKRRARAETRRALDMFVNGLRVAPHA